jgi:NCS2 family nucleobase:cation symporter-2
MAWSFDARFIVPFAVASLACAMVTTAVVTSFQRITDADWVRPDMGSIAAGMRGDGAGTLISGALCTYGQGISPSNAGLVSATGVASRVIAYPAAGLLLLGAVVPAIGGLLIILPVSTLAAAVLFPASFMMISGVQIITSRVLDARRTLVIGLGVLTFILISAAPKALADAPEWLQPIVGTPLVLAMLVALGLNLVFRIGIRRQVDFPVQVGTTTTQQMEDFVTRTAATWGARQDTVGRVKVALVEATEVVSELADRAHPVTLRLAYDEFDIDLTVTWRGEAFDLRETPPTQEDFLQERGHHLMAGFLIRQRTDRAGVTSEDGMCALRLKFKQ